MVSPQEIDAVVEEITKEIDDRVNDTSRFSQYDSLAILENVKLHVSTGIRAIEEDIEAAEEDEDAED